MHKVVRHIILWLLFSSSAAVSADDLRRIGGPPVELPPAEALQIGELLCGPGNFRSDRYGIHCATCPAFTSDAGTAEEWSLAVAMRTALPNANVEQLLFDTDGCEPHFQEFGGALLLQRPANADAQPWTRELYTPGFRLDDCLHMPRHGRPTLLACNEESLAQGEVVGHLSVMRVKHDAITRWRLLRWYDNSGADSPQVLRIVPTAARVIEDKAVGTVLQVALDLTDSSRAHYESAPGAVNEHLVLRFEPAGDRLFPDLASRTILMGLEKRMAAFLDE